MKGKIFYSLAFLLLLAILYVVSNNEKKFSDGLPAESTSNKIQKDNDFVPTYEEAMNSTFSKFVGENQTYKLSEYLQNENGKDVSLFIHFWATWCAPCLEELPQLVHYGIKNSDKLKAKFIFIAVNDQTEKVLKFLNSKSIDYKSFGVWIMDNDNESYKKFRVDKLPETFVISKDAATRLQGSQEWK